MACPLPTLPHRLCMSSESPSPVRAWLAAQLLLVTVPGEIGVIFLCAHLRGAVSGTSWCDAAQLFYQGEYAHAQFLNFGKIYLWKFCSLSYNTSTWLFWYLFLEMNNSGKGAMLVCLSYPLGCSSHPWVWELWFARLMGHQVRRMYVDFLKELLDVDSSLVFGHELAAWHATEPDLICDSASSVGWEYYLPHVSLRKWIV